MNKLRIFLAAVLCVSLFTFAGCGNNNDTAGDNANNGTVTEENADMRDGNGTNSTTNGNNGGNNGSVVEDMADDAKDAAEDMKDDVENAVDGNDRTKTTEETRTNQ